MELFIVKCGRTLRSTEARRKTDVFERLDQMKEEEYYYQVNFVTKLQILIMKLKIEENLHLEEVEDLDYCHIDNDTLG